MSATKDGRGSAPTRLCRARALASATTPCARRSTPALRGALRRGVARDAPRPAALARRLAYVDQGYTGERAAHAAAEHGIPLKVVKLPEAERGFVLPPRRRVVERTFAWMARFRRLARDYERLPETLVGLHLVAFVRGAPPAP